MMAYRRLRKYCPFRELLTGGRVRSSATLFSIDRLSYLVPVVLKKPVSLELLPRDLCFPREHNAFPLRILVFLA